MACMKCGKKTKDEQVFCTECLAVMEQYPVKRDIHIQLPSRANDRPGKRERRRKRNLTPEEMVVILRSRVRRQRWIIFVLVILLLAALAGALYFSGKAEELIKLGAEYTNG